MKAGNIATAKNLNAVKLLIYFSILFFINCNPANKFHYSDKDLSSPIKSLAVLTDVLLKKDTLRLKEVTTVHGYEVIIKEITPARFNHWATALKEAYAGRRIEEYYIDSTSAMLTLKTINPVNSSIKATEELVFGKENNKWKFALIARGE